MRLVLATPLYPPDMAGPAPYVKELAQRLAAVHDITIVAYGAYPEQVAGVRIVAVDKHRPVWIRLTAFFFALQREMRGADAVIVENGASVELPAGILARLSRTRFVLHIGDVAAHERTRERSLLAWVHLFFSERAACVITDRPLPRPEVLPYAPRPDFAAYETSWETHLRTVADCLHV